MSNTLKMEAETDEIEKELIKLTTSSNVTVTKTENSSMRSGL